MAFHVYTSDHYEGQRPVEGPFDEGENGYARADMRAQSWSIEFDTLAWVRSSQEEYLAEILYFKGKRVDFSLEEYEDGDIL